MARVPQEELSRIKREVSVERLVEGSGVELRRHGKDLVGRCPFHDDRTPSLVVTPSKNLWHCLGACQTGGGPVDWVMKTQGVSFRHAVELLRGEEGSSLAASKRGGVSSGDGSVPKLRALERDVEDEALLGKVIEDYHETLKQSPEALAYLAKRGLRHGEVVERFRLGYANRTLGYRLPPKDRKAGEELRGRLQRLGLLRPSGHEHFVGSLVIPIFDRAGRVVEAYGRKIGSRLRKGTPLHLYLPGPHRGVWNEAALAASREVILCESLIDALTFWCAGLRHVTASYGVEGFTEDHRRAFVEHGVERVLLAYDRDEAGDKAAQKLAVELGELGIDTARVQFPKGMDANDYALKLQPAAKSLGLVVRQAVWLGSGAAAKRRRAVEGSGETGERLTMEARPSLPSPSPRASEVAVSAPTEPEAKSEAGRVSMPVEAGAVIAESESEPRSKAEPEAEPEPKDEVTYRIGDRHWRVRGLPSNASMASLKVNLMVRREGGGFHVDTLELYSARHRQQFMALASEELEVEPRVIKKDLGQVLLQVEELLEARSEEAARAQRPGVVLSEGEQAEALALLRDPKLVERLLADFEACGVVGERTNKLVGFLAATSRMLSEPLAVVIQSSSAAGKSSLMEAILAFVPDEARVQYSAMTGQSLFYMGEQDLQHKVLAIVEEEGAERASYALKLLQSEGELTIASTGKDPVSGRLVTQEYRVVGPVMIFLTTTAVEVDEELLNRCLVLSVDEGRAQTRAIHERQRRAQTLEGILQRHGKGRLVALHQNAQRLLRPLQVVNPYAERLSFLDHQTRTRRDHMKYLTLIRTIALLHQYQREVKTVEHQGEALRYIEVTPADIAMANRLCREVLGRSLDELPPQTRRLLGLVDAMVEEVCARQGMDRSDVRFSRRQVRDATGWGDTQLKVHLGRLREMEYVVVHRQGASQRFLYELVYQASEESDRHLPGLLEVEALEAGPGSDADRSGLSVERSGLSVERSGPGRAEVGGMSGGGRREDTGSQTPVEAAERQNRPEGGLGSRPGSTATATTYVLRVAPSVTPAVAPVVAEDEAAVEVN